MFRSNVAALIKYKDKYLACKRSDYQNWQSVQGGIEPTDENTLAAIQREMREELGVKNHHFNVLYQSKFWRRYYFSKKVLGKKRFALNVGQEQMWFHVELEKFEKIDLTKSTGEFSEVKLLSLKEFIETYPKWKLGPFYDFCRELNLI